MYTKLHTEGIVLKVRNVGEADRMYGIFTKDLGMVYARGRGVRNVKSLQRFALQPMSLIDVSFVRSKQGWRVTNVAPKASLFSKCGGSMAKRVFVTRVCVLLKRLVLGEDTASELFSSIRASFDYVFAHDMSVDELKTLEVLTALRALHFLGYLKEEEEWGILLQSTTTITPELIAETKKVRPHAVREINKSLKETQL